MSPPKVRVTNFELHAQAYLAAPGLPKWTKPLARTFAAFPATLGRIEAEISVGYLFVRVPLHAVVTNVESGPEVARSKPIEVVELGRVTHDVITLHDVTIPEPVVCRVDLCAKAKVVKTKAIRFERS